MEAITFWKTVAMDTSNFLDQVLLLLDSSQIRYCVIGGQAVNAYVDPVVSLDLDIVIAIDQIDWVEELLRRQFQVQHFPHSINVALLGSDLRLQIQTDPRYISFIERATTQEILGLAMPVAAISDVLQGKIWAALDPQRRASKRQKDLADIARLLEAYPHLRQQVPSVLLDKLL
jgi:hypothetical protein